MQSETILISHFQKAVIHTVEQYCSGTWGRDIRENWGFTIDLKAIADKQSSDELQILDQSVTTYGVEIHATVGDTVASVAEITHAVYHLLGLVAEGFLVILPMHSDEALRYWFMTGYESHGHLGEVIIERKEIQHISVPALDIPLA